jgi:hypothetical protein
MKTLENFKRSDSKFLLTTTFLNREKNDDLEYSAEVVQWRPLNLMRPPFDFPLPLRCIVEGCTEGSGQFWDKALILVELRSLFE